MQDIKNAHTVKTTANIAAWFWLYSFDPRSVV